MSSEGFVLLWSKILDSSIWMESKETRLVWITLLAMKNKTGLVKSVPIALAHRARVTPEECREALNVLLSPDPNSGSKAEQGCRIREVPGGWFIINHEEYRFSTEAKREFWREQKRKQREAQGKPKPMKTKARIRAENDARETRFVKAQENGDAAEADRIAAEGL